MSQTLDMLNDMLQSTSQLLARRPGACEAPAAAPTDHRGAVLADLRAQVQLWRSPAAPAAEAGIQPQEIARQLERAIDLIEAEAFPPSPHHNSNA